MLGRILYATLIGVVAAFITMLVLNVFGIPHYGFHLLVGLLVAAVVLVDGRF